MPRIQISLDSKLLRAVDRAARECGKNRSAFVRDALRHYLANFQTEELERLDQDGYLRYPDTEDDLQGWEKVAAWPPNDM